MKLSIAQIMGLTTIGWKG